MPMPVPSSYNDITQSSEIRDHVGWAWYQRPFRFSLFSPEIERVFLRFGSAHYNALVWVNGQAVAEHSIGHLPFEADVTDVLKRNGEENIVTVAINNTLDPTTIPQVKKSLLIKFDKTNVK